MRISDTGSSTHHSLHSPFSSTAEHSECLLTHFYVAKSHSGNKSAGHMAIN